MKNYSEHKYGRIIVVIKTISVYRNSSFTLQH